MSKTIDTINEKLLNILPQDSLVLRQMRDSVAKAKGKYLRAHLCVYFSGLYGCKGETVFDLATAIELMHLASLLQDDVFDNEEHRRRSYAFHIEWDKTLSVLYSDIAFAKAFSLLLDIQPRNIAHISVETVSKMCKGEILHKCKNNSSLGFEEYIDIIAKKTASLFEMSCLCGSMLATEDKRSLEIAGEFGLNFGIAYQLIDDCIDLDASDSKNNIITMPQILKELSCSETIKIVMEYIVKARESLQRLPSGVDQSSAEKLFEMIKWLTEKAEETRGLCKERSLNLSEVK